jgi:hypothetical protein
MGTTSIIALPLAIRLAYFCLIGVVSLSNLLAAIKSIDGGASRVPSLAHAIKLKVVSLADDLRKVTLPN